MSNQWGNPSIQDGGFPDPYEKIKGYERKQPALKEDGTEWSIWQDSIQDHPSWDSFTEGFADENLGALIYNYATVSEPNKGPTFNPNYSYMDDPALEDYSQYIDFFKYSNSAEHTQQLIRKFHDDMNHQANGPAYWTGRVVGGLLDPTSLLWFTKAGKFVFTGGRISTAKRAAALESGQEVLKHQINPDRTFEESAWLVGGAFVFPLVFGNGFRGKLTFKDKKRLMDSMEDGAKIHDFQGSLNGKNFTYKDGPTNKWRNTETDEVILIDSKTIKSEMKNKDGTITYKDGNWKQVGATHSFDDAGESVITIHEHIIKQMWKQKSWRKGIAGVKPLKDFKSYEQFKEFVINHELTHMFVRPNASELKNWKKGGKAAYENRINKLAWKHTSESGDVWTHAKHLSSMKNKKKLMEAIADEQMKPTILGKIGEGSNWNVVNRIVNTGNLAAIKVINQALHLPFIRNKNLKGIATEFSVMERMALDRFMLGEAMAEVVRQQKKWNKMQNTKANRITLSEFRKRVSLAVMDDTIQDNAQVMAASQKVREFYRQWADRIQESRIMERGVEKNINFLKEKLSVLRKKDKTILAWNELKDYSGPLLKKKIMLRGKEYDVAQIRKLILEQEEYLAALKKNVRRKNYLNIFIKKDRIQKDEAGFDIYARKSIQQSHPELKADEITEIIESFKGDHAWEPLRKTEVDLKKSFDDYNLEIILNPVGLSGHLKARKLNLNYQQWMKDGWIEDDIMALMQVYNRSVGPDVHLAQIFGDQTMWGGYKGKNIGIGEVIAEYKLKYTKAKTKAAKLKIQKEAEAVVRDLEAARDLIRGTYGVPLNPSRVFSKAVRISKNLNALTQLTGALAALPDAARLVMTNGFMRTMRNFYEQFSNKQWKRISDMAIKESRLSGESWDVLLGTRAMAYADLDNIYGVFNKFERATQKFTAASFVINLMSPWNQFVKSQAALAIQSRIIEESQNWAKGIISDKWKMKMAASGIDERMAKKIAEQYEKHGHGKTGKINDLELEELRLSQSDLWTDIEAQRALRLATNRDINITIVTPQLADTPLWMSTEWGGAIAQYKKFGMGAYNRMLVRGLQEKDAAFFGGLIMLISMGMMVDMIRHKAFNRDYSKTKMQEKLMNGIDRSGVLGIFMDVNNSIERLTNNSIGLRAAIGANRPYGTDSFDKAGAILGPSVGQLEKIYNISTDWVSGQHNHHTARNVRRLMPLNNIFYLDGIFDSFEKGIK